LWGSAALESIVTGHLVAGVRLISLPALLVAIIIAAVTPRVATALGRAQRPTPSPSTLRHALRRTPGYSRNSHPIPSPERYPREASADEGVSL